jgi:hypothetical protein
MKRDRWLEWVASVQDEARAQAKDEARARARRRRPATRPIVSKESIWPLFPLHNPRPRSHGWLQGGLPGNGKRA